MIEVNTPIGIHIQASRIFLKTIEYYLNARLTADICLYLQYALFVKILLISIV